MLYIANSQYLNVLEQEIVDQYVVYLYIDYVQTADIVVIASIEFSLNKKIVHA